MLTRSRASVSYANTEGRALEPPSLFSAEQRKGDEVLGTYWSRRRGLTASQKTCSRDIARASRREVLFIQFGDACTRIRSGRYVLYTGSKGIETESVGRFLGRAGHEQAVATPCRCTPKEVSSASPGIISVSRTIGSVCSSNATEPRRLGASPSSTYEKVIACEFRVSRVIAADDVCRAHVGNFRASPLWRTYQRLPFTFQLRDLRFRLG